VRKLRHEKKEDSVESHDEQPKVVSEVDQWNWNSPNNVNEEDVQFKFVMNE